MDWRRVRCGSTDRFHAGACHAAAGVEASDTGHTECVPHRPWKRPGDDAHLQSREVGATLLRKCGYKLGGGSPGTFGRRTDPAAQKTSADTSEAHERAFCRIQFLRLEAVDGAVRR